MTAATLTSPELAERWTCGTPHVGALIRSGELKAFDISLKPGGKPRWKIYLSDVVDFEARRSAKPPVKPVRRTRKKQDADFVEYF